MREELTEASTEELAVRAFHQASNAHVALCDLALKFDRWPAVGTG